MESTPIINHFSAFIKVNLLNDDSNIIDNCANQITQILGLNVVEKLTHSFSPHGKTLVYILSESHLAIHTWPEKNIIHIDLVSCKVVTESEVKDAFLKSLNNLEVIDFSFEKHGI
jgi:S-adenosylmethionine decarboxylase